MYSLIDIRLWDIYIPVELRKVCKFTKQFMYLKRAPDSSGRALLRCGMSLGPSAAGGCLTSATLLFFKDLQV